MSTALLSSTLHTHGNTNKPTDGTQSGRVRANCEYLYTHSTSTINHTLPAGRYAADTVQIPLQEFRDNLHSIADIIRHHHPSTQLILITPTLCDFDQMSESYKASPLPIAFPRPEEGVEAYVECVLRVGAEINAPTVDAYEAFKETIARGSSMYELTYDGLHFTPRGYQVSDPMSSVFVHTGMYPSLS